MRLELVYHTEYRYDPPIGSAVTALRLRPLSRPGLSVESSSVNATPGTIAASYIDGWGTNTDLVEVAGTHAAVIFEARATVETTIGVEQDIPPSPSEWALFTGDSLRVRRAAVARLGWNLGPEGRSWDAIESALQWMPQRFVYMLGATDAATPIEAVIDHGCGVCQDFAHVFLAMLRSWGWAARYVSGYVYSGEAVNGRIESEAMHAWVQVYRPGSGWTSLDPTVGLWADERYVPVGFGRDYEDVQPFRGILAGNSHQEQQSRLSIGIAGERPPVSMQWQQEQQQQQQ